MTEVQGDDSRHRRITEPTLIKLKLKLMGQGVRTKTENSQKRTNVMRNPRHYRGRRTINFRESKIFSRWEIWAIFNNVTSNCHQMMKITSEDFHLILVLIIEVRHYKNMAMNISSYRTTSMNKCRLQTVMTTTGPHHDKVRVRSHSQRRRWTTIEFRSRGRIAKTKSYLQTRKMSETGLLIKNNKNKKRLIKTSW